MAAKKKKDAGFAAKMKKLRKKNKIEMEQLSRDSGCPVDYLEKVESGEVMPPVSDIIKISNALVVDAGTFLSAEEKASRKKKAESFKKREKAYSYKVLTPDAGHKHMKAFQVSIDPGEEHEKVEYKHAGEEFIYVLEGRLEIKVGRKTHELKKGKSIHFDSSLPHMLRNPGRKKTELIVVVYTP